MAPGPGQVGDPARDRSPCRGPGRIARGRDGSGHADSMGELLARAAPVFLVASDHGAAGGVGDRRRSRVGPPPGLRARAGVLGDRRRPATGPPPLAALAPRPRPGAARGARSSRLGSGGSGVARGDGLDSGRAGRERGPNAVGRPAQAGEGARHAHRHHLPPVRRRWLECGSARRGQARSRRPRQEAHRGSGSQARTASERSRGHRRATPNLPGASRSVVLDARARHGCRLDATLSRPALRRAQGDHRSSPSR